MSASLSLYSDYKCVELNSESQLQRYLLLLFLFSDTSAVLGKFCGTSAPVPVISTSNHLRVAFHSDNTTKGKGFLLEYSLVSPKEPESPSTRDFSGESVTFFSLKHPGEKFSSFDP